MFGPELHKHCKATLHKLFFSSEQLFVLTMVMHLFHYFMGNVIFFFFFGMCMTAWRMAALHVNASVLI